MEEVERSEEEIQREKEKKISALRTRVIVFRKLKTIFLVLGIILLVASVIGSIVTGVVMGSEAIKQGIRDSAEAVKWAEGQPAYRISIIIFSICLDVGVPMIIIFIVFSIIVKRSIKEMYRIEPNGKHYFY